VKLTTNFKPTPIVAYMLVTGTALSFAASTVVQRGVHEDVPAFGGSFWRWFLAALVLWPIVWHELPSKKALLKNNWQLILLLGFLLVGSSALLFLGLNFTTAINGTLINASQPALTVLPAWLLSRDRITIGQSIGILAAFGGIFVMVSKGNLMAFLALELNVGDIMALGAVLGWAIYATSLHRLPTELGSTVTLFVIFLVGSLSVLPFYIIESVFFRLMPLSGSVIGIIAFLGITSLAGMAMWNTALRTVGPNRATIFLNLVPVFGVSLAIIFLGERLYLYHLAGAGLVGLGIFMVVSRSRRAKPRNAKG